MKADEFVANAQNHCDYFKERSGDTGLLRDKLSQALSIIESQRAALQKIAENSGYPDDLDGDPCQCTACRFARIARQELERSV